MSFIYVGTYLPLYIWKYGYMYIHFDLQEGIGTAFYLGDDHRKVLSYMSLDSIGFAYFMAPYSVAFFLSSFKSLLILVFPQVVCSIVTYLHCTVRRLKVVFLLCVLFCLWLFLALSCQLLLWFIFVCFQSVYPVLWIRIQSDPTWFERSGTNNFGSGSG